MIREKPPAGWTMSTRGDSEECKARRRRLSPAAQPFAPVHVTTEAFPGAKRLAMWREIYGRNIGRFDIEPLHGVPFHADVTFRALPGLGIASGARSDAHYRMTRELAAQMPDNLIFAVVTRGVGIVSQFGREAVVEVGGAVLLSGSDPSVCTLRSFGRFLTLAIPRQSLAPLIADIDAALVRAMPQGIEPLQLLTGYLGVLQDPAALESADLAYRVATHIEDLVAVAVGATHDAAEIARGRGVRVARLAAVKADIAASLGSPDLSPDAVAARQRLSPRYLRKLFEHEGTSFSAFVLEQRLARAHRMLTDPQMARRGISAIAFATGFGDLSYFNRTFRRRYGAAPSEVREQARRDAGW